jgi:Dyp-type peroxidase family
LKDQLRDVQGIIVRGYVDLPGARFVPLRLRNSAAARQWLGALGVTDGGTAPTESAVNIAFTYDGIRALGLPDAVAGGFSEEFIQGMTTPQRRKALGDVGASAPESWSWGGPTSAVHLLLMLYAVDQARLETLYQSMASGFVDAGLELVGAPLDSMMHVDQETGCVKEHFGFCDALSQPFIEGLEKDAPDFLTVKTGEIILGYLNEYGKLTERPLVPVELDRTGALPADAGGSSARDFGRNGTYLVFRQLHQDACRFWQFTADATRDEQGESARAARIRLASKMVGRWPSGAPLVLAPDSDAPETRLQNDFRYHDADPRGLKCPLGSHIRRTNPRDSLGPEPGSSRSIAVNKRHQILRRGRIYGEPVARSMDPDDIMDGNPAGDRGLHFICMNANISRQFEFVQQSWVNNAKFSGLYDDPDPLIGARDPRQKGRRATFTVQAEPVRERIVGLPEFVTVRGGGYFFMPGLRAIRYLASL